MKDAFQQALKREHPLQIVGAVNAYTAMMAENLGFSAIYISGAGVANVSMGLPDEGNTTLDDVTEDLKRISNAVSIPILVDIDTGFNHPKKTAEALLANGASACQIEDQQPDKKRCGHLPGKSLISTEEMCEKIAQISQTGLFTIARTDAYETEGMEGVIRRCQAYEKAGADALFADAIPEFQELTQKTELPVLANMTEFGKTPLYTKEELLNMGVSMILYPLSCFRAQSHAAQKVLQAIKDEGSQKNVLRIMQTRDELYRTLRSQP